MRRQNIEAATSAAHEGRIGDMALMLRADPSLATATDDSGRTILHWAVAGSQATAVKYLLGGRWEAASLLNATDAQGDMPLHLYRGPPAIAALLLHGAVVPPGPLLPHGLHEDAGALDAKESTAVFSFLCQSARRTEPARKRPAAWLRTATPMAWCLGLAPAVSLVALVLAPPMVAVCTLFVVAVLGGGAFRVLSNLRGADGAVQAVAGAVSCEPLPALITLTLLLLLLVLQNVLCLPTQLDAAPLVAACHLALQIATVAFYGVAVTADPGFVAGGAPADREAYWAALEGAAGDEKAGGGAGAPGGGVFEPAGFCLRSELRALPRARYSPYCKSLVRCMDHDCVFLGVCIGEGNHRSFLAFLCGACLSLLGGVTLAAFHPPPAASLPGMPRPKRLYALGMLLGGVALLPLGQLLLDQARRVASNVTSVEERRWQRRHPMTPPPSRPHDDLPIAVREARAARWREYAPLDKGTAAANVAAFLRCERGDDAQAASKR